MKIESVDLFYLAMPEVRDIGDGSQDMLLVRVRTADYTGWGECEASSPHVHCQFRVPDVTQRLSPGTSFGHRTRH